MEKKTSLLKGEFIGSRIKVIKAKNKDNVGISGEVIDETKNTFVIKNNKGKKTLLKEQCTFKIYKKNKTMTVDGRMISKRPEDRIKLKI